MLPFFDLSLGAPQPQVGASFRSSAADLIRSLIRPGISSIWPVRNTRRSFAIPFVLPSRARKTSLAVVPGRSMAPRWRSTGWVP